LPTISRKDTNEYGDIVIRPLPTSLKTVPFCRFSLNWCFVVLKAPELAATPNDLIL